MLVEEAVKPGKWWLLGRHSAVGKLRATTSPLFDRSNPFFRGGTEGSQALGRTENPRVGGSIPPLGT